jgi:hypothetical protein
MKSLNKNLIFGKRFRKSERMPQEKLSHELDFASLAAYGPK